jgi:hypothetical protein
MQNISRASKDGAASCLWFDDFFRRHSIADKIIWYSGDLILQLRIDPPALHAISSISRALNTFFDGNGNRITGACAADRNCGER